MERRKSPRVKCRYPCEVLGSRHRASGTVLDLSEGGLSVLVASEADQGENLRIRFQAPDGVPIEVEGLLWHSRRVRDRASGENAWVLGLMISHACDAYPRLVTPPRASAPEPTRPKIVADTGEIDEEELLGFRIRVRQRASSRTRLLTLSAQSDEEARALAETQLQDGWEVLEVLAA
jgi:hypothetical protein